MKLVLFLVALGFAVGCAAGPRTPTIRGADLYARLGELEARGRVLVPSSGAPVVVRRDQYLVDRGRGQIFTVAQAVDGCDGLGIDADAECTLALVADQRFAVEDAPPPPRRRRVDDEGDDISPENKARLLLLVAGTGMAVGAARCDAFDGCGTLLGVGAAFDGLLLLLMTTGMR